ncbi:DUF695 domain-containing protein [Actinomadura rudentiformis]|uniref:DUF695 domain-containing protein n=1 Tax=Actinomadura rudentiformis TaxID=359158 RepID=A0A6H9YNA8_9ACTN|nr:DUF695 domain-containing protein [Actinomadura rudentiformis]KAB2348444.1 DUF695 domain-containing protein [Actinomadura rudentiformis]
MASEHAVFVNFALSGDGFGLEEEREAIYALEDRLEVVLRDANVGESDGHEFGAGGATIFFYGADAEELFRVIEPVLRAADFPPTQAELRFGSIDDEDCRVDVIPLR